MDLQKQIKYWVDNSVSDFETAEILIKNGKILHGLFFGHLTIEKILKAHVVKSTKDIPPKTHNLLRLLEKTDLQLNDNQIQLLNTLMVYLLEGRYPEYYPGVPSSTVADRILAQTKDLLIWLKEKL